MNCPWPKLCPRSDGLEKVVLILFAAASDHNKLQVKSCNHLRKNKFMRSAVISTTVSSMADRPATLFALLGHVPYSDTCDPTPELLCRPLSDVRRFFSRSHTYFTFPMEGESSLMSTTPLVPEQLYSISWPIKSFRNGIKNNMSTRSRAADASRSSKPLDSFRALGCKKG